MTYYIGIERDHWILSLCFLLGGLAIENGHDINYRLSTASCLLVAEWLMRMSGVLNQSKVWLMPLNNYDVPSMDVNCDFGSFSSFRYFHGCIYPSTRYPHILVQLREL